jgi:glutamyl/glutaminyl-tRNA synthetase
MLTRIAPTPSGYLHVGNVINALLTSWWAQSLGLTLALRVDDHDIKRYRSSYADDIFRVLGLLDIEWTTGPASRLDLELDHSQHSRYEYFQSELSNARDRGLPLFRCSCSRHRSGSTCQCRNRQLDLPSDSAIRLDSKMLPKDSHSELGDVVLWTKENSPSYQLVSIVTDRDLGTTHILRGLDLAPSSALQIQIAPFFAADNVAQASYLHHQLVLDNSGTKLAKSSGAQGQPLRINQESIREMSRTAAELGAHIGISAPPNGTDSA